MPSYRARAPHYEDTTGMSFKDDASATAWVEELLESDRTPVTLEREDPIGGWVYVGTFHYATSAD